MDALRFLSPTQRRMMLRLLLGVASGLAACRDQSMTNYRIPKEEESLPPPAAEAPGPRA